MTRNSLLLFFLLFALRIFSQTDANSDTTKRLFESVEKEAAYPGGEKAWRKFLERNLNPGVPVKNGAPNGRYVVIVQFVVNKEGHVVDIKPLTKEGYGMEEEVVRAMSKSGIWSPAINYGKLVNAYRKQSFTFVTATYNLDISTKTPFVLYTDADNEIAIKSTLVNRDNLEATISEGTIINNGDGKFTARGLKPGRVVITVYNKKRNNKEIGKASFEVKDANVSSVNQ